MPVLVLKELEAALDSAPDAPAAPVEPVIAIRVSLEAALGREAMTGADSMVAIVT